MLKMQNSTIEILQVNKKSSMLVCFVRVLLNFCLLKHEHIYVTSLCPHIVDTKFICNVRIKNVCKTF